MQSYTVTIAATVTKQIEISAKDPESAEQLAHEIFSVMADQNAESYEQETVSVKS